MAQCLGYVRVNGKEICVLARSIYLAIVLKKRKNSATKEVNKSNGIYK